MSVFVVDVSVGVKWFVPEIGTPAALRLRGGTHELHIPAFFDVELANILWKKVGRGELVKQDADDILSQLRTLPVTRHADGPLVTPAFQLATQTQRTVYDCLYLALAVQLAGVMVTADERLVNILSGSPWAGSIVRAQDVA